MNAIATRQLETPCALLDLDKIEENIREVAELCQVHGKYLYPMVKTHKSIDIARMQSEHGAAGFLVGTLDEAEQLITAGFSEFVMAYPVAGNANVARLVELSKRAHITASVDGLEAAILLNEELARSDMRLDYLIIVDCGLHRFGVSPQSVLALADRLSLLDRLDFKGISSHPGQVYGTSEPSGITAVASEEIEALELAANALRSAGYSVERVETGSTPTMKMEAGSRLITTLRPGNYVFYDAIQVAMGVVPESRCALTVLATVISNPAADVMIVDAGSKALGLDKGAHSSSLVHGFGRVAGHEELLVESLSEEVAKIRIVGSTSLSVGDKIEIIPNHACSASNLSTFLIGHRGGQVDRVIRVDARNGNVDRTKTAFKP